jgi:hypothetical protein
LPGPCGIRPWLGHYTGFDCTRRKFLLAVGLPESAVARPFEWVGWTAGLERKALGILAENQDVDMLAVIAEAVEGRNARRSEVRAGVAAAEQKVRDAQEAARLVEARLLVMSVLPIGEVHALLQRYEGHHARQMAEAIRTLDTLRRAKAAKYPGRPDGQDRTPAAAS